MEIDFLAYQPNYVRSVQGSNSQCLKIDQKCLTFKSQLLARKFKLNFTKSKFQEFGH